MGGGWAVLVAGLLVARPVPAQARGLPEGTFVRGPLRLALTDSTYRASLGDQLGATGRFERRGDTLVARDTGGPRRCAADVAGTYLVTLRGDTLHFTAIDERCAGRRGVFSGGPFVRSDANAPLILEGVFLLDGTGAPMRGNMSIVVRAGRIAEVYPTGSRAAPSPARVMALPGRWVIPGLIDAHVHIGTAPSGGAAGRSALAAVLRRTLRGGVTTVRDMAGDVRVLIELARATLVGDLEGPDIHYTALWAGADFMGDPRVATSTRGTAAGAEPWMRTVDANTDWATAAAEARGTGARGVKLYADATPQVVAQAARAAHAAGLRVWAHAALFPARPSDLVTAGVDVVSHAPLLVWEAMDVLPPYQSRYQAPFERVSASAPAIRRLLASMRERGTLFEPTLVVFSGEARNRTIAEWAMAVTRGAAAAGVEIVAGTDDLLGPAPDSLPNIHRELELLVQAGLTPQAAIEAATRNAARALGIQKGTGTLEVGMNADLLVLGADPLSDIRNTQRIELVMKRGVARP